MIANTKENRLAYLRQFYQRMLSPVDKQGILEAVEELNNALSKERQIVFTEKGAELGTELGTELWAELGTELRAELVTELVAELGAELGNELRSELKVEFIFYSFYWIDFINNFYPQLEIFKKTAKKVAAIRKLVKAGNAVVWITKTKIYVLPFPVIRIDERKRLHSETSPALLWLDKQTYWLYGRKMEKELWEKISKLNIKGRRVRKV